MLALDLTVVGMTRAAEQWLDELGLPRPTVGLPAPAVVSTVAARLRGLQARGRIAEPVPMVRVRTSAGRWAVLHASWMTPQTEPGQEQIAVIIEQARPLEVAPLLLAACGLTPQERAVSGLVARGLSTREIADSLFIAETTVQDHLKSIFDKTGTRSRRHLVATLLADRFPPYPEGTPSGGSTG